MRVFNLCFRYFVSGGTLWFTCNPFNVAGSEINPERELARSK